MEKMLEAGALDALVIPAQMKKGRPGVLLQVIAEPEKREELIAILFRETTTLGVRFHTAERRVQARKWVEVEHPPRRRPDQRRRPRLCARIRRRAQNRVRVRRPAETDSGRSRSRILKTKTMKYYLTTPLYYVNAAPHIGHTYTTLAADTIKRFKRMQGFDVALTTGTDEHGQKVERSAQAAGKAPQEFTDIVSNEFRSQWDTLGIQYDHFIRTTDPRHHETVRWLFERCKANGYVYKGTYTGQYCVFDEALRQRRQARRQLPRLRPPHRNRHRRELLLQALGLRRQAAQALRRQSRFHRARIAQERSHQLRARRLAGPLDQPHDSEVGHSARRQSTSLTFGSTR